MKKKIIVVITLVLLLVIAAFLLLYLKTDIFKKNKNMSIAKNRKNYVISEDLNLSNSTNKEDKTLVIFWATWCSYCVEESQTINEYITSNPQKSIIIVSHDHEKEELENYLKENNYNWFVIFDPNKTIRENLDPGSKGIPSSYLLDLDNNIINYHKGVLNFEKFVNFFNGEEI